MYKVCSKGLHDVPHVWNGTGPEGEESKITGEYENLEGAWGQFLWESNMRMMMDSDLAIYKDRELLAYTMEHPQYNEPDWDEFDRYRIRVTGAMPLEFKLKLIEEVRAGKRHMREF